jgi:hypothetical protein
MRERTEPSGRCADADDRKRMLGGLGHPGEYRCEGPYLEGDFR